MKKVFIPSFICFSLERGKGISRLRGQWERDFLPTGTGQRKTDFPPTGSGGITRSEPETVREFTVGIPNFCLMARGQGEDVVVVEGNALVERQIVVVDALTDAALFLLESVEANRFSSE